MNDMNMNWYSVKLLYKMTVTGKPEPALMDEYFSNSTEFFEESIVLAKADSFENAFQIAEDNARKNTEVYINKYGQAVTKKLYDTINCFELCDSPQMLTEVYSTIFCKNEGSDENSAIDKRYESCSVEKMHMLRYR